MGRGCGRRVTPNEHFHTVIDGDHCRVLTRVGSLGIRNFTNASFNANARFTR